MFSYVSQRGKYDWLIQRISAVVLLITLLVYFIFLLSTNTLEFSRWHRFILSWPITILTGLSFISIALHSWVGIWTVITDYIPNLCLQHIMIQCLKVYVIAISLPPILVMLWMRWS